jgi:manganese/zinc/iron transport system substrate-binding protein
MFFSRRQWFDTKITESIMNRLAAYIIILLLALTACSAADTSGGDSLIDVVTTTTMIADVVQNVGGGFVRVTVLMGTGVDPHQYNVSESDINTLSGADIIFYNGLNLEANMTQTLQGISGKPVVAAADAVPQEQILQSGDVSDPHIWMDASLWALVVGFVRDTLAEHDSVHAENYRMNAEAYIAQINELHAYAQEQINRIPEQQRVLVTAHAAFQYFGRAYGIEVLAPQGFSATTEASTDHISRIVGAVVQRQIPAIFSESGIPSDGVETIIEGAAENGHTVIIGGSLYADSMDAAVTAESTYTGMMRHNVDTIVRALLGDIDSEE